MQAKLDPQEDLLNYFERVNGWRLKTKGDLDRYLDYAQEVRPPWLRASRVERGWPLLKQILLAVLFAVAAGQYIFLDAAVEIASLPGTIYFLTPGNS